MRETTSKFIIPCSVLDIQKCSTTPNVQPQNIEVKRNQLHHSTLGVRCSRPPDRMRSGRGYSKSSLNDEGQISNRRMSKCEKPLQNSLLGVRYWTFTSQTEPPGYKYHSFCSELKVLQNQLVIQQFVQHVFLCLCSFKDTVISKKKQLVECQLLCSFCRVDNGLVT